MKAHALLVRTGAACLSIATALALGAFPKAASADAADLSNAADSSVLESEKPGSNDEKDPDAPTVREDGWTHEGGSWQYWRDNEKLTGIQTIEDTDYLFDAKGNMSVGWAKDPTSSSWCYSKANGSLTTGWQNIGGTWYLMGKDHLMLTGWQSVGSQTYLLGSSGDMKTGWVFVDGGWYLLDGSGVLQTGWKDINGSWYWLDPSQAGRAAQDEMLSISGSAYAFGSSCRMVKSGWGLAGNSWYLASSSGSLESSWHLIGKSWYWLDPNTYAMVTGLQTISGSEYLFAPSGDMVTGWGKSNGNWYLASTSGVLCSGWQRVSSNWYWLDPTTHVMLTGTQPINGKTYHFAEGGAMLASTWHADDKGNHWFGNDGALEATVDGLSVGFPDGAVKDGLTEIGDSWYFLDHNVIQTQDQTIDGTTYHFDKNTGAAITGWQKQKGSWLYYSAQGAVTTGWVALDGTWYYMDQTGIMQTGWLDLNGTWYWLDSSGAMQTGWIRLGDNWYYLDSLGAMKTGWVWDENSWYYLDTPGTMHTGWLGLNGTWYYLDPESGYMHTGWTWDGSSHYWLNEDGSLGSIDCRWQDMFQWAQSYYSDTNWLVLVDTSGCRTAIYQGHHGAWKPIYEWICSPGAPSTPTVTGEFTVYGKGYSFGNGYTCYYYTQFYDDYLFHSVLYYQNTFRVMDGRLGQRLSHGCVRLDIDNAKWMYDNIPYGTKVIIW